MRVIDIAKEAAVEAVGGGLLERMRGNRNVATVLKVRLASIRTQAADALVLVVEGLEDKTVYFHWFKQLAPLLRYEVLVCNGKGKLLAFRELLQRDLGGSRKGVYFLVDRDFDGLRGQTPGFDVYVTDTYSVENHLVSDEVLDHILRIELHCDGAPVARSAVLNHFALLYKSFLEVTKPINQRIFLAKRIGINGVKPWPDKINLIAKVTLAGVSATDQELSALICLEREPTTPEIEQFDAQFAELDPRAHYRGKFAIAFLNKILQLLAADRACQQPTLFPTLQPQAANGSLTLDAIASKSSAPQSLRDFMITVLAAMEEPPLAAV